MPTYIILGEMNGSRKIAVYDILPGILDVNFYIMRDKRYVYNKDSTYGLKNIISVKEYFELYGVPDCLKVFYE